MRTWLTSQAHNEQVHICIRISTSYNKLRSTGVTGRTTIEWQLNAEVEFVSRACLQSVKLH